jgi:Cellulase (glycosyl hydrolase family 5)
MGAALTGGVLTHAAQAAGPEIGVSDDRILIAGGPKADKMVAEWKRDGVDVVRIYAVWKRYAPKPNNRRVPAGFDAADPSSGYNWFFLDQAVNRVENAGMKVMLTIGGPAPRWATTKAKRNGIYKPKAKPFANFAHAVAERYGASVDRYLLWNEPNSGFFLLPQKHAASATVYRNLVRAAYPAVKRADRHSTVLIGALAPKARDRRGGTTSPLAFLRSFGCVDSRLHKVRKGSCKHYKAPKGDGFAVHPYGAKTAPDLSPRGADDLNIATLGRLQSTVDRLRRIHRLQGPRHMGIYVDEYGYQTNPPDKKSGVSPHRQDLWIQQGAYLAWRNHRIKLLTQYLWYDEPKFRGHYSNWQSGLRYARGKAKPALRHFAVPFTIDTGRNLLWGQARAGGRQRVIVQIRRHGRHSWSTLKRKWTDSHGYWKLKRHLVKGASYRFKVGRTASSSLRR